MLSARPRGTHGSPKQTHTDPVPLAVLQHPHLLLQSLTLPLQLLFPLTRPLGLVPRPLELRLQLLQLQVGQGVQAAGALKSQGRTVQHCEGDEKREDVDKTFSSAFPPVSCYCAVSYLRVKALTSQGQRLSACTWAM